MPTRKKNIFYARTYRRLRSDLKRQVPFLLLVVLPTLVLFLLLYPAITRQVSEWAMSVMSQWIADTGSLAIAEHPYIPQFGPVCYLSFDAQTPSLALIIITLVACLVLAVVFTTGKRAGMPLSIFGLFCLVVQLVSCVFFLVNADAFPYGGTDYSALYMLQQVGIWLFFIITAGLTVGLIGYGGIPARLLTFFGIVLYSFVFGAVRYITFMFIVAKFSTLFMAELFFSLGPFFDFLYLVFIYSLYIDYLSNKLNRRDLAEVWRWA